MLRPIKFNTLPTLETTNFLDDMKTSLNFSSPQKTKSDTVMKTVQTAANIMDGMEYFPKNLAPGEKTIDGMEFLSENLAPAEKIEETRFEKLIDAIKAANNKTINGEIDFCDLKKSLMAHLIVMYSDDPKKSEELGKIVRLLIAKGANPNAKNSNGESVLYEAVEAGAVHSVVALLNSDKFELSEPELVKISKLLTDKWFIYTKTFSSNEKKAANCKLIASALHSFCMKKKI